MLWIIYGSLGTMRPCFEAPIMPYCVRQTTVKISQSSSLEQANHVEVYEDTPFRFSGRLENWAQMPVEVSPRDRDEGTVALLCDGEACAGRQLGKPCALTSQPRDWLHRPLSRTTILSSENMSCSARPATSGAYGTHQVRMSKNCVSAFK